MLRNSLQKSDTFRKICNTVYQKVYFTKQKFLSKMFSRHVECISNIPAENFCQKSEIF